MSFLGDSRLHIQLLGTLQLSVGGKPRALPSSKRSRALLGFLVASARAHSREALCELLWETPDDPRAALRWSLAKIRPLLDAGQKRLVADRESVHFEPIGVEIDLIAAREAASGAAKASTQALIQAADRFHGGFLEGLDLPDCYGFHEWWVAEREAARALHTSLLDLLCERLRGDPERALPYARARVALDPLAEEGQLEVIALLGGLGRKAEALKQYDTFRRILDTELHARPSARIEQARVALDDAPVEKRRARPAAAVRPMSKPSPGRSTLIGRQVERAVVQQWVDRPVGDPQLLLVIGDPGIGKSRLLEEVALQLQRKGARVLAGKAFEAEKVRPYGAWIEALRTIADAPEAPVRLPEVLSALWPEVGSAVIRPVDRSQLFDGVATFLEDLSASSPVGVLLDDVQWLDEASAGLLHFVARTLRGKPVFLACGARGAELQDNPAASEVIRSLGGEGRLLRLDLGPMNAGDTALLARSLDPAADADRIFAHSEGNPLLALELTRASSGATKGAADTPAMFDALIGARLERLKGAARDLLPWAASLGRRFEVDLLARGSSLPVASLMSGLEELERQGLLRAAGASGGYDFAHDLIRQAAYAQISEPRRRLIHQEIAHTLMKEKDPDDALALDLARHAALGGETEAAVRASLRAAERCLRLFANTEAILLSDHGLALVDKLEGEIRYRLKIALLHLKTFAVTPAASIPGSRNRWRELSPGLEIELGEAIRQAQEAGLAAEAASGFFALSALSHLLGDREKTEEGALRAAEASSQADPPTAARTYAFSARCLVQIEGDMRRARELSGQAKRLADAHHCRISEVHLALGLVHRWDGDLVEAERELEAAYGLAKENQDRWREASCLTWLTMIDLEQQRYGAAMQRIPNLELAAGKLSEGSEVPFAAALHALARFGEAKDGADAQVDEQVAALQRLDSIGQLAYVLELSSEIDLAAGRRARAMERAEQALAAASRINRRNEGALARTVLARGYWASGKRAAAREVLAPILGLAADGDALHARARAAVREVAAIVGVAPKHKAANSNAASNGSDHVPKVEWAPERKEIK